MGIREYDPQSDGCFNCYQKDYCPDSGPWGKGGRNTSYHKEAKCGGRIWIDENTLGKYKTPDEMNK